MLYNYSTSGSKYSRTVYIGDFKDNKKHGPGVLWLQSSNFEILPTNYVVNMGMLTYTFDRMIVGIWRHDRLHGFANVYNLRDASKDKHFFWSGKRWKYTEDKVMF